MKFTITKESFLKGLNQIQSAVPSSSTVPIVLNVLMRAEKQKLVLVATDMVVTIKCTVEANVKKTGAGSFPAKRLLSVIRELPQEEVDVEMSDNNSIQVKCGTLNCRMYGLPAEEFPFPEEFENPQSLDVDGQIFKGMLKKTIYAASVEESRAVLNGILLNIQDRKLTVVATDGRRMALVEQETELEPGIKGDLIIPSKTAGEIIRAFSEEGKIKIKILPKMASFETGNIIVTTKLIEGVYPNFRQVIPGQCEERLAVGRETFIAAIQRAIPLTSDKSQSIKLKFDKNQLQMSVVNPDVGETHETIPIKYAGKPIEMSFNPEYLLDPLKALVSDEIYIELVDELSPAVIKSDIPFLYVLMPLRLN